MSFERRIIIRIVSGIIFLLALIFIVAPKFPEEVRSYITSFAIKMFVIIAIPIAIIVIIIILYRKKTDRIEQIKLQ